MNTHTETFDQLLAQRDAGVIGNRDFVRRARSEHRAAWRAYADAQRAAERADIAARRAERDRRAAARYADETLRGNLSSDWPGERREAEILLTVPKGKRAAVVADAHRFRNATADAGRWSDALRTAARHA